MINNNCKISIYALQLGVLIMKIEEVINEINRLYKKSQEEGLTEEEKVLQQQYRKRYIDNVKNNFRAQLNQIRPNKK